MSLVRYITALTIALALMAGMFTGTAFADTVEQNQKLEQEIEIECTSGAYGQNSTCKAKGKQTGEQSQKISGFFRDGKFIPYHKPVDTGLDAQAMALVGGVLVTGSAAAYLKVKSRKA